MTFYPILARSGCSKMLSMLHVFRFSPLKVVFAHPLMQPLPCPITPAKVSTIVVIDTQNESGRAAGDFLSHRFKVGLLKNARYAGRLPFFSLKGRFRSSIDAARALPRIAPAKVSTIAVIED